MATLENKKKEIALGTKHKNSTYKVRTNSRSQIWMIKHAWGVHCIYSRTQDLRMRGNGNQEYLPVCTGDVTGVLDKLNNSGKMSKYRTYL